MHPIDAAAPRAVTAPHPTTAPHTAAASTCLGVSIDAPLLRASALAHPGKAGSELLHGAVASRDLGLLRIILKG